MGGIKVLALDIYGTVLSSDDCDNVMPLRRGIERLFDKCEKRGIKVVSCSDANLDLVKIDLKSCGLDIGRFDYFFHLNEVPYKNFSRVIVKYGIIASELLVVGDSEVKDITAAKIIGAKTFRVNEYVGVRDNFDLSSVLNS